MVPNGARFVTGHTLYYERQQMKKAKNPMAKFRSAIRLIWSRSAERKQHIKEAVMTGPGDNQFTCPLCSKAWPIQMADVDHVVPIGALNSLDELTDWTKRLFYSEQRAICKLCHRIKTKEDMKRIRDEKSRGK